MVKCAGVTFPPYAAACGWYAVWLRRVLDGASDPIAAANSSTASKGKDFARMRIAGPSGELMLSIPVEGGGHSLQFASNLENARISEHGAWQRVHRGGLEAAYGRAPFFTHFAGPLNEALANHPQMLRDLNLKLHDYISRFILSSLGVSEENAAIFVSRSAVKRGEEIARKINPGLSIVDLLMRLGSEGVLGLLEYNKEDCQVLDTDFN